MKPRSALGMWAVATSIIVSAPPTKGSLTRPTLASSKTHKPSHSPTILWPGSLPAPSGGAWYYTRDQQKIGPVSTAQLNQLLAAGQPALTDMALQAGTQKWVPINTVDGLRKQVPEIPPAAPKPFLQPPPLPAGATPQPMLFRLSGDGGLWVNLLWLHLRRAFAWDLRGIPISTAEQYRFASQGINHPTLQRYLGWRRSVLVVACVPVALIALLSTADNLAGANVGEQHQGRDRLGPMVEVLAHL
jgi:hypothetical protein